MRHTGDNAVDGGALLRFKELCLLRFLLCNILDAQHIGFAAGNHARRIFKERFTQAFGRVHNRRCIFYLSRRKDSFQKLCVRGDVHDIFPLELLVCKHQRLAVIHGDLALVVKQEHAELCRVQNPLLGQTFPLRGAQL